MIKIIDCLKRTRVFKLVQLGQAKQLKRSQNIILIPAILMTHKST